LVLNENVFQLPLELAMGETALTAELRANGYKLTRQRLAVVRVLGEANEHFTASQVLEQARAVHPGIGLTTVYRTLEVLSELGLVRRVHLEGRCHAYAPVREREGHHLVCQKCHRVVDFPCTGLPELVERTARETGFAVESHLLELVGLCPSCQ
jgi:Fur family ferric uptake transcriptional regulator